MTNNDKKHLVKMLDSYGLKDVLVVLSEMVREKSNKFKGKTFTLGSYAFGLSLAADVLLEVSEKDIISSLESSWDKK